MSFVVAALGTLMPGIPGSILVVIAIVTHKYLLPDYFSWLIVGTIAALGVLSSVVDFMAGVWGAKLGGATREGIIGAAIGGMVGVMAGLPGLIVGPFVGAIIGDIYAKRTNYLQLFRSGLGAATGFIISLIARFILLFAQAVVVLLAIVFHY